jgi:TolB-like protein
VKLPTDQGFRARWERLGQHGAFQAAVVFLSGSWLVLQAADIFDLPTGAVRALGVVLLLCFIALVIGAWIAVGRAAAVGGDKPGASPKAVAPRRLRGRLVAVTAAVLFLAGFGAWWARPRLLGSVRPGTDVIAILPFTASGPSVELLGEGLVDLLSTNLDEVGAIRTINPRAVLYRWRQAAAGGSLDQEGALRVGRAVGAGSVLLGSVVEAAGTVRLSAQLLDVDGARLARAQVSGALDSVLALADALSIALLREIWRGREPMPELRLSAITTESPAALRAFLRGEQFARASQWDSARLSFERAVALDSTFALAHMRLSEAYGWSELLGSEAARQHSLAAERFADRLPARERALVVAHRLHEDGDPAAADSLAAYTARYPDDAVALRMLGDVRFHAMAALGATAAEILEPFEAAQRLDPSYAPAYQHPLEIALILDDTVGFQRYRSALAAIEHAGGAGYFDTLAALRWGPRGGRQELFEAALARRGANLSLVSMMLLALHDDEAPSLDDALAALAAFRGALPGSHLGPTWVDAARAQAYMHFGRFREGAPLLDSVRSAVPALASLIALPPILGGVAPHDVAAPEIAFLDNGVRQGEPLALFWRGVVALVQGDTAGLRTLLDRAHNADQAGTMAEEFRVLRGLHAVAMGDTAGGLRIARSALRHTRYGLQAGIAAGAAQVLDLLVTLIEVTRPESRERAIGHLDFIIAMYPTNALLLHSAIARAYEAAGRPDRAARLYSRFPRFWENADPELQPHVNAARRELERLMAEGART